MELTADAAAAGLDLVTVSHSATQHGTVAEDADFDLPLLPEWSLLEGVTVEITDPFFGDGFERVRPAPPGAALGCEKGDTTAWSSTTP